MEEQLLGLLERFRERLPAADYEHVRSMIEHREWGIGLEDLCSQLFELSIAHSAHRDHFVRSIVITSAA